MGQELCINGRRHLYVGLRTYWVQATVFDSEAAVFYSSLPGNDQTEVAKLRLSSRIGSALDKEVRHVYWCLSASFIREHDEVPN